MWRPSLYNSFLNIHKTHNSIHTPRLAFDVLAQHHLVVLNGLLNKTDSLRRTFRYSIVIRQERKVKCFVERFYVIFPGAISSYVLSLYGCC